jgi:hypothetical protein
MVTISDDVIASRVMRVEGSPCPETGPSTHTPWAISVESTFSRSRVELTDNRQRELHLRATHGMDQELIDALLPPHTSPCEDLDFG